ncbi:MAG: nitrogen regulation protein NR(I) [Halofilum sp. (in: g-proteobacteria)]|nr:nitrogen regulation protein NR(I) [Halofilum sp. (in: g-proteobacteria)]
MTDAPHVWIIDDDASMLWVLERALKSAAMDVRTFERGDSALAALDAATPDAVITDVRMPGIDGLSLAERMRSARPGLPVLVMTAHSDLDTTVAAFEGGAFDYLAKPFDLEEAVELVRRACAPAKTESGHAEAAANADDTNQIIGQAPAMQTLFRTIGRLARAPITVLITGESGTGKERVAQALHRHSPRARGPFVALNTAAIPRDLLESELFGHEKGAFTGADARRQGRFEQADGGTLFLDEIGDMPAELQTRLLRVLSEGVFYRVGGATPCRVDVRILAATHQDLERRVERGEFREDLYHRLNVVRLPVPALRERREDIPLLAAHFLEQAADELGMERKRLTAAVEDRLMALDWPGNVRQLENVCRWLTVMAAGREIHLDDLPVELQGEKPAATNDWEHALANWARSELAAGNTGLGESAAQRMERILIREALTRSGGHRQEAARLLGWGRNTLTRKIRDLGIEA